MRRPQGASDFPTFRNAPEEVLEVVRERLSKQEYVHTLIRHKMEKIFGTGFPLPMVFSMERQHWYVGPPKELGELRHWSS